MRRVGIISDIHGRVEALKTALQMLGEAAVDKIVVCGDVVGYGFSPNECCEMLRELDCVTLAGNHDWAVVGLTDFEETHSAAAIRGIEFTRRVITSENLDWLRNLPLYFREEEMEFAHASLVKPEEFLYLTLGYSMWEWQDVRENFAVMNGTIAFVGHLHYPTLYLEKSHRHVKVINPSNEFYELDGHRAIICVGSVGEPRSNSRKASLVVYDRDARRVWFKRFAVSKME
jgi:predicted phosphodiesterase